MALSATTLYRLTVDQLRLEFSERGLSSGGPARELRRRLAYHLRNGPMEDMKEQHSSQASVPAGMSNVGRDAATPHPL